uniref:Autophagy_act_C domain-containing protein n=1 Tax=Macrostomum lignano TaxID=282301 RepID=A0A1I8GBN7_9PLAT
VLPEESLVLASWDPISPSNWTSSASSTGNSSSTESPSNRFECFTKEAAIPPPRLAFYLGGIELTSDQTRYPVEWLFNTEYSTKPRIFKQPSVHSENQQHQPWISRVSHGHPDEVHTDLKLISLHV